MPLSPDRHTRPGPPMRCSPPPGAFPRPPAQKAGVSRPFSPPSPPCMVQGQARQLSGQRPDPSGSAGKQYRRRVRSRPRPTGRGGGVGRDGTETGKIAPRPGVFAVATRKDAAMDKSRPPRSAPTMRRPRIGQMRAGALVALAETDRTAMGRARHCPSRSGAAGDPVQAPGTNRSSRSRTASLEGAPGVSSARMARRAAPLIPAGNFGPGSRPPARSAPRQARHSQAGRPAAPERRA